MRLLTFLSFLLILCGFAKAGHAGENEVIVAVMPVKLIGLSDGFKEEQVSSAIMELLQEALAEAGAGKIAIQVGDSEKIQDDYNSGELSADIVIIPRVIFEVRNGLGGHKVFMPIMVDIRVYQRKGDEKGVYMLLFSNKSENGSKPFLEHVSESWIIRELAPIVQDSAGEICEDLFTEPESLAKARDFAF